MRLGCRSTGSQCRLLSSKSSSSSSSFQLPPPTWSVQDLELSKSHPPISNEELQKLAKRALLDLDQLDDAVREELRQDLGNMMHMIEKVQSFQHNNEENVLTDQDIYDKPRGVTAAPLRNDSDESVATENTTKDAINKSDEQKMAKQVWESFLQPKTTKVGAHEYFSIETKRE